MKPNLPTHAQRVAARSAINGQPYPYNPRGLLSDDQGRLVTWSTPTLETRVTVRKRPALPKPVSSKGGA